MQRAVQLVYEQRPPGLQRPQADADQRGDDLRPVGLLRAEIKGLEIAFRIFVQQLEFIHDQRISGILHDGTRIERRQPGILQRHPVLADALTRQGHFPDAEIELREKLCNLRHRGLPRFRRIDLRQQINSLRNEELVAVRNLHPGHELVHELLGEIRQSREGPHKAGQERLDEHPCSIGTFHLESSLHPPRIIALSDDSIEGVLARRHRKQEMFFAPLQFAQFLLPYPFSVIGNLIAKPTFLKKERRHKRCIIILRVELIAPIAASDAMQKNLLKVQERIDDVRLSGCIRAVDGQHRNETIVFAISLLEKGPSVTLEVMARSGSLAIPKVNSHIKN